MAFERPTVQQIADRMTTEMETRLTGNVAIPIRSLLRILIVVFAGAIHLAYGAIVFFGNMIFPDTAETTFLDRQADYWGLQRKAASSATGKIQITGTPTTIVPQGTAWQDDRSEQYLTDQDYTIEAGGSVTADVTAESAGLVSNTSDLELDIVTPIVGVDSTATVTDQIDGGAEEETDPQLRERLLQFLSSIPSSGRAADYERWALSVEGVANTYVLGAEQYLGPGTVGVFVSDENGDPVANSILTNVKDKLNLERPLGVRADGLNVDNAICDFDITVTPNTTDIQTNIQTALEDLFAEDARPKGIIFLSRITSAIMSTGVQNAVITDIRVDTVSIGVSDIDLSETAFKIAKLGTINYSN